MSGLFRITLLGLFAACGVGLAICFALSDSPPPDATPAGSRDTLPEPSIDLKSKVVKPSSTTTRLPDWSLADSPPAPKPSRPSPIQGALPEPTRPMISQPAPIVAQQVPPVIPPKPQRPNKEPAKEPDDLQKIMAAAADNAAAEPVAKPAPADTKSATDRKSKSRIDRVGEGDSHLSLDFQDADIREVLELISRQGQLNILPSNSVKGKVSASLHDVDLETALSAILKSTGYVTRRHGRFIYVGTSQDFQNLEQAMDRIGSRIYHTNYVKASDLQALITPLLTTGVGACSVTAPSETGIAADNTKAGGDTFAGGEAVLVRDYEAVLAQVDQVVAEIDKRPMQVAIEAMILSVKLNDNDSIGVDFRTLQDKSHIILASGSPPTSIGDANLATGGLTFGFLDSTLGFFLNALETIGDTHVIATPRVVCVDKHRAEILIGSQLGYISSTVTETSTAQNVNFLEVGTQLRLRPFISTDGLIRMEVHPELSTGQVTVQQGLTLPNKDLTQVTTNVMIRDGATVVIGGLIREDLTTNTTQIPLLGNMPGIGFLFRQKSETTQRTEILVLITPHIVYDAEACAEGNHGAMEFHRREAVYADQMSPLGKRHVGRKYYRLAQEAWARNDQTVALRFIDLAIHVEPLNRSAIDLRTDLLIGNHHGEHTTVKFPVAVAAGGGMQGGPMPAGPPQAGQPMPGWMINDLDHRPAPGELPPPPSEQYEPIPQHPLDPGQPGTSQGIERPHYFQSP